jgi:hypothetical protein
MHSKKASIEKLKKFGSKRENTSQPPESQESQQTYFFNLAKGYAEKFHQRKDIPDLRQISSIPNP